VRFAPVSPSRLAAELTELMLARHPIAHPLRVALDGPRCANLGELATSLGESVHEAGRPVALLDARTFYRDASVRLEYGKTDVESFYSSWLDVGSLQREVLDPVGPGGNARCLPSLRDPATNRATRADPILLANNGILILTGELLLGVGLTFDLTIHASVSRQARRRLTEPELAWTLPAFDRYDLNVQPANTADVVLRYDDPRHPAMAIKPGSF
jgi:hypothetical protein